MTRSDRETLIKIARQRERLAKAEAKERAAHLIADFERQMDRNYAFNENEVWEKAMLAAKDAVAKAKEAIAEECAKLGIPREFAPSLSLGWYGQGQNAVRERRADLRRIAAREIDAAEKSARTAIERQSLQVQEQIMVAGLTTADAQRFLDSMPTAETLMPALTVGQVEALIEKRRDNL